MSLLPLVSAPASCAASVTVLVGPGVRTVLVTVARGFGVAVTVAVAVAVTVIVGRGPAAAAFAAFTSSCAPGSHGPLVALAGGTTSAPGHGIGQRHGDGVMIL